jgi:hypothetical protein
MHFLGLVEVFEDKYLEDDRLSLIDEASQLRKIFSSMLTKIIENSKEHDITK